MRIQEKNRRDSENVGTQTSLEAHRMYRLGLEYGRLTMRWRWYILALWLVGLLVSLPLAANSPGVLKSGGYDFSGTESYTAYDLMLSKLHFPAVQLVVVFQSASTPV